MKRTTQQVLHDVHETVLKRVAILRDQYLTQVGHIEQMQNVAARQALLEAGEILLAEMDRVNNEM